MAAPNVPAAKRAGLPVDLDRLAAEGDGWLTPEDRYALKTHGACAQRQPGVFMVRIRVPGGRLLPEQALGVADLAEAHGGGWVHVTTRQNLELHHVDARSVPAVLGAVDALGLTSRSACGHTLRNVMACPDAGVGLDEPFDCLPDAVSASAAIVARSAELNAVLPSRINMSFGGCPACAEHARLNDAGFESVVADGEPGYRLWAGGSLGVMPSLAVPLADFVARRHATAAAVALAETFIALGDLDNPKQGRMKFVLEAVGADAFRAAWRERFDRLAAADTVEPPPIDVPKAADIAEILGHAPEGGWGAGVRPQRTPGLALVTAHVPLGDLDGRELRALAALARYGSGALWLTRNQDVQWRDVPVGAVGALRHSLVELGLGVAGADTSVDVRACTGSAVCALAITDAPAAGGRVAASPALGRNGSLRIHVSGCPNSCAQHQAGDIGFGGAKVRIGGRTQLGYTVFLGADLAAGRVGEAVGRVADDDVEAVVSGIVGTWEVLRRPGERLVETVDRLGTDAFAGHVSAIAAGFAPGLDEPDPVPA
jgi:sulfite reductase beta subunit-like hemoprotein